ncbi:cytidine deaminase [Robertkochia marina]|uniref:Cytidine deaminase n=1 Tax=Robertkochia marina TaxID=1227945 RepID=A0A4S3M659_9FLAO|nr:cytidine deaminase [Robertkochia marina]THD69881.1 cytidine deaminase [Robertkochia marina]TRZ46772.1 cytidine deaminase [Robertkochia marina]
MKKIELQTVIEVYPELDSLPEPIIGLMHQAIQSRKKAYAPYSRFRVGAAVLLENGAVVLGNNQENAAFPSGLCAERVAVSQAGAVYPGIAIKALAITAAADDRVVKEPVPPCGSCRQVLTEYEHRQSTPIDIYFMGEISEIYKVNSIAQLLPLIFTGDSLQDKTDFTL